jgi:hypothetical protein
LTSRVTLTAGKRPKQAEAHVFRVTYLPEDGTIIRPSAPPVNAGRQKNVIGWFQGGEDGAYQMNVWRKTD